jgi:hypothetical protein
MAIVRGNIVVSEGTAQSVRLFIEEAVRAHILELSAEQTKSENENISENEVAMAIEEAVQWAREE